MRLNIQFPFKREKRVILLEDYSRLIDKIHVAEQKYVVKFKDLKRLKRVLLKSRKVEKDELTGNIVSMNSVCKVNVINTGTTFTLKLVYPEDENITNYNISIFSSFGVSLLGMKAGNIINYHCKKRYKVKILSVLAMQQND